MRVFRLTLFATLAVTACVTQGGGGAPAPMPQSLSSEPTAAPTFATELAGPGTFLPPMPTAVIILKPDDMERNRAFCRAAMSLPTARQAEAASPVAPNLIRTRWLVQIGEIAAAHAQDCDYLVGTYDYARAGRLTADIRTTDGSFYGRGPYLLMIIPDSNGLHVAGLDGSSYGNGDLNRFIGTWNDALAQSQSQITASPNRPGIVRSIFDLISAVFTSVTGGATGLIRGVFTGL
jgi:hypothetical protein